MLPHSRHRQTLIAPLVATLLAGAEEARRNRVSHQQRGQLRVLMTSAADVLISEPHLDLESRARRSSSRRPPIGSTFPVFRARHRTAPGPVGSHDEDVCLAGHTGRSVDDPFAVRRER